MACPSAFVFVLVTPHGRRCSIGAYCLVLTNTKLVAAEGGRPSMETHQKHFSSMAAVSGYIIHSTESALGAVSGQESNEIVLPTALPANISQESAEIFVSPSKSVLQKMEDDEDADLTIGNPGDKQRWK